MKFLKQSQRVRQSKCIISDKQQENRPPAMLQTGSKQNIPSQVSTMEDQAMEPGRKEEHLYLEQIVKYIANIPQSNKPDVNYFKRQPDISQHMRMVLLNWLVDVHLKYKLQPKTLFITIYILDAYLSKVSVKRTQLQLVGIVSLWIASKYQQTYQVPKLSNLVFICDSTYTKQQILEMETLIIQVIDFNILVTTQLHYFQAINQISNFHIKDYYLCRYILELCLFELQFLKYHPKIIAASTAYFVRKLRRNQVCWSFKEEELFQVTENDLRQCAREICLFWQRAENFQTFNSLKNKFQSSNFKQVSKIKIGQAIKNQPKTASLRA